MVSQKLSILFYLKRKKITSDGKIPLYVRVTIDGLKDEFSSGYKICAADWDNETKRVLPTDPNCKQLNKKLNQLKTDLERHFDLLQVKNGLALPAAVIAAYKTPINGQQQKNDQLENAAFSEALDAQINSYLKYCDKVEKAYKHGAQPGPVKKELLEQEKEQLKKEMELLRKKADTIFDGKERTKTLVLSINEYLLNFMELAFTGKRSYTSLEKMIGRKKRYLDFLRYRYKAEDLPLASLEYSFITNLYQYLLVHYNVAENTATKYCQWLKEIVDRVMAKTWVTVNVFAIFKCHYTEPEHNWPALETIIELYDLQFEEQELTETRDIVVYQAFCGLSYQELYTLTEEDTYYDGEGQKWINKNREKTNGEEAVPLLPICLEIEEKYKNHPVCKRTRQLLPVPTNQHYNRCIKRMAAIPSSA